MIDVTVVELGWCAGCNVIVKDATMISAQRVGGNRQMCFCPDCWQELAEKVAGWQESNTHHINPEIESVSMPYWQS